MIAIMTIWLLMVAHNIFMVKPKILSKPTILMVGNIWQVKIKIFVSGKLKIKLFSWGPLIAKVCNTKGDFQRLYIHIPIFFIFRRERGFCQICWSTTANGDFELSGENTYAAGAGLSIFMQ